MLMLTERATYGKDTTEERHSDGLLGTDAGGRLLEYQARRQGQRLVLGEAVGDEAAEDEHALRVIGPPSSDSRSMSTTRPPPRRTRPWCNRCACRGGAARALVSRTSLPVDHFDAADGVFELPYGSFVSLSHFKNADVRKGAMLVKDGNSGESISLQAGTQPLDEDQLRRLC